MFGKIFTNQGPWGSWDNNKDKDKKSNEIDDVIKKGEDFIKKIMQDAFKDGSSGGNNNKKSKKKNSFNNTDKKKITGLVFLGLILLWLSTGFYKVEPDEEAVILYFGKYHSSSTPGLDYHIPYPIGQVIKLSVTNVNTEEFGFSSTNRRNYSNRNLDAESLMLTGDENIVDIEFQIQWQISDIQNFIFNISDQTSTIRKASESAIREIIARTPISDALAEGKKRIEDQTKTLLQQILDSYGAGVQIALVQLRRVDPPSQVIDSYRDVQTARANNREVINKAESYSNDIIPRAKGKAAKMIEEANAYKQEVIAKAEGEIGRYMQVFKQYKRAKRVTKKRIYLETMERLYSDIDKIIIDGNASKSGVVPYLPLNNKANKITQ
jgi:modulator of FtsH protease HflK|tara:strand:+ start:1396 stop:2535 length:1140 start_codon:yes stop_codon:yes gene_type:complete